MKVRGSSDPSLSASEGLPSVVRAASAVLRRHYGPVELTDPEILTEEDRRNLVIRCAVSGGSDLPSHAIIKKAVGDESSAGRHRPAARLLNDWAGIEFLTGRCEPPVAPRFYGGDWSARLVVMEDLGSARSLADDLTGDDEARAEEGLVSLARTLGRMHAGTTGKHAEFDQLRTSIGGGSPPTSLVEQILSGRKRLREALRDKGVEPAPGFLDEVRALDERIANPGPFSAYIHGDPCPDNYLFAGSEPRLIDFEFGTFAHALLDGVYWRILFPTCWCAGRSPQSILERVDRAYREALSAGCPAAADDDLYQAAVADACAFWVLSNLQAPLEALDSEEQWGLSTQKRRVMSRLAVLDRVATGRPALAAIRETAARAAMSLGKRWSLDAGALPPYPAFRQAEVVPR